MAELGLLTINMRSYGWSVTRVQVPAEDDDETAHSLLKNVLNTRLNMTVTEYMQTFVVAAPRRTRAPAPNPSLPLDDVAHGPGASANPPSSRTAAEVPQVAQHAHVKMEVKKEVPSDTQAMEDEESARADIMDLISDDEGAQGTDARRPAAKKKRVKVA